MRTSFSHKAQQSRLNDNGNILGFSLVHRTRQLILAVFSQVLELLQ